MKTTVYFTKKFSYYTLALLFCLGILHNIINCGTTVKRTQTSKQIDLSGRWNDVDSQLVSKQIISDMIKRPWLNNFHNKLSRKPIVIVGTIQNLSSEYIESQAFTKDIEREVINSGKIRFVADSTERKGIRQERNQQHSGSTDIKTIQQKSKELGADFYLSGSITSIEDREKNKRVIYYQVDLQLIYIETNEKVWIGTKKIKKYVKKPLVRP